MIGNGFRKGNQPDHRNAGTLVEKTTLNFAFTPNKSVGVYLWLAPFRPSPLPEKPCSQLHNGYYHCGLFLAPEYISGTPSFPRQSCRKDTNSSFPSLVLRRRGAAAGSIPAAQGSPDSSPFSSSFSWARGSPSKPSCGRLHVGIQSTCPKYVQPHSLILVPKSCR